VSRSPDAPRRRSALRTVIVCALASGVAFLASRSLGRNVVRLVTTTHVDAWPQLEHLDLELDLSRPPQIAGRAVLRLAGIDGARVPLILNRDLQPTAARLADGTALAWSEGKRLRSDFFREARLVWIELGQAPADGRIALELEYAGRGSDGSDGRDWRGLVLMAADELRMSEQSVFYPQLPVDLDGPAVQDAPGRLSVTAPEELEVAAPGARTREGAGRWRFELSQRSTWSLVAAGFVLREVERGGASVRVYLRPENAAAGEACEREALAALAFFAGRFGPAAGASLCVVEMRSRGPSYNWFAPGLVTIESNALDDPDQVTEGLAHEIAHLWWGGSAEPRGPGERFLTESLAEYSSWRYLESVQGEAARLDAMQRARGAWLKRVHATEVDPGLEFVRFETPGYTELAYSKGPLVLGALEAQLGREAFDRALALYAERGARGEATLATFHEALRAAAGADPDAPWLHAAGHAHVELRDAAWSGGRFRGVLVLADCPAGLPPLVPAELELALRSRGARRVVRVAITGRETAVDAAFEEPLARADIDPQGRALLAAAAPAVLDAATLVSREPADGANVPLGPLVVRLTFDRPLGAVGARELDAIRDASVAAMLETDHLVATVRAARLAPDGRTLELDIGGSMPDTTHVLDVPDHLADADGLPIRAARLTFRTAPADEESRPSVVQSQPATGARDVPADLGELRITFSEPMRAVTGFPRDLVRRNEGEGWAYPPLGESDWVDVQTLVWRLKGPLEPGRRYALPFRDRYRDLEGNPLRDFDLRFETAAAGTSPGR